MDVSLFLRALISPPVSVPSGFFEWLMQQMGIRAMSVLLFRSAAGAVSFHWHVRPLVAISFQ